MTHLGLQVGREVVGEQIVVSLARQCLQQLLKVAFPAEDALADHVHRILKAGVHLQKMPQLLSSAK